MRERGNAVAALATAVALLVAAPLYAGIAKVDGGIEFTYDDPSAGSVHLAGSFNNWNMNAQPLTQGDDGVWRVVVDLEPGEHEYKFVVNGSEWIADPGNPRIVGDYGNSGLTVGDDGELVAATEADAISNTPANSRVMLNGWYRATYETRSDVEYDPRWRLDRPAHEVYLDVSPTVTSVASGSAMLRLSTGTGDIKEVSADIYSGHATLEGGPFSVTGFYNEEVLQFDDPLETVGHRDLDGTIPEEHIPFGRGAQGIIIDTGFWDFTLNAAYANVYDLYIMNDPGIYDNTETDLVAARLKRDVGPATFGATYTSWRDGWWIDWTGENSSAQIDEFKAETGSQSDWFELARTETWIGIDAGVPVGELLYAQAEYAWYLYESLWDMGNKEKVEGEDYSNGAIDVPIGDTDGGVAKLILSSQPVPVVDLRLEVTRTLIDSMGADELYVGFTSPQWYALVEGVYTEVKYDGSPLSLNVFGPAPERYSLSTEFDGRVTFGIFDVLLEYDRDAYEWEYPVPFAGNFGDVGGIDETWSRFAGTADVSVHDRLDLGVDLEYRAIDFEDEQYENPSSLEFILRTNMGLWQDWSFITNLRTIHYADVMSFGATGITYVDEAFFAPYLAFVYSPRENVEVRVGYGVDPSSYVDAPVEGRGNGRERWMSQYLWEHSEHDWRDAEEALEDAQTVGVMAVITF
jgi:hypothetical protein